jgi:hypothetical protein
MNKRANWKLIWALALIFMLCVHSDALPHYELPPAEGGPTTTVGFMVSGGNQTQNNSPRMVSNTFGAWSILGGQAPNVSSGITTSLAPPWWTKR